MNVYRNMSMFFPDIFAKRNNFCKFLFASWDVKPFLKWGLLLKESIAMGATSFRFEG